MEEADDVMKDVYEEAIKYGEIKGKAINRNSGVIYVHFADLGAAKTFQAAINGKQYGVRKAVSELVSEAAMAKVTATDESTYDDDDLDDGRGGGGDSEAAETDSSSENDDDLDDLEPREWVYSYSPEY